MTTTIPDETESSPFSPDGQKTFWHKSAPQAVRRAYRSGKHSQGWTAWVKHLAARSRPSTWTEVLACKEWPLDWTPLEGLQDGDEAALLARIEGCLKRSKTPIQPEQVLKQRLARWAESAGTTPDARDGLEAVGWCWALPSLAKMVPADAWWAALDHLTRAADDAERVSLEEDPHLHQLLAGELPLTMAYLFPEIAACRRLAARARRALSAGPVDLLDGEGLPHGRYLHLLGPLLWCWTRCRVLGEESPKGCWSEAAEAQYEWLVRHALRLVRRDGTHAFSTDSPRAPWEGLFATALRLAGDESDARIAAVALPGGKKKDARSAGKPRLPKAAYHSQWAAAAVLKSGWSRSDPRLVVNYHDASVQLELSVKQNVLWSGEWQLDVSKDGERLPLTSEWEEVCWLSDEDVDYLELEAELTEGLSVQRHMLLAREDGFLLLADAILGNEPGRLEYRGCLPLGKEIDFQPAGETTEGFLVRSKKAGLAVPRALVMPLGLPEWREDARAGTLEQTGAGLELRQSATGTSLLAPLFFDLKSRRMVRPLTWRQLTVAENLQQQPDDVAVGYRVMVGKRQWLIYRSLAEPGNRTLLGHNLSTEMLVGRFDRKGEVEPLVEIE